MFIELTTTKGEKITLNIQNIVLIAPDKKGTILVDVNGLDWQLSDSYESLKEILRAFAADKPIKNV